MTRQTPNLILRTILPLAAALLATACSKSSDAPATPGLPGESEMVMDFGGNVDDNSEWNARSSRALDPAGIATGSQFGVFAYRTGATAWSSANSATTPNIMYNQMVEKTATGATYSPTRSWSTVPTDKYTFFAYMPYSDGTDNGTGITMNTLATTKSTPKINFTIPANAGVDLLATQVTDRTPGDYSPVVFTFKHVTTRIRFAIAFNANMAGASAKVTGIRLSGIRDTGILTLGGTTNTTPSWSTATGNASYTILDKDNAADDCTIAYSTTPTVVTTPNGCYMIPFATATVAQPIVIEIDYAVTTHEGSEPYVKTTTLSLSGGTSWAIGKSMLYTLTLQRTTVTLTGKVEDWDRVSLDDPEIILIDEPMF